MTKSTTNKGTANKSTTSSKKIEPERKPSNGQGDKKSVSEAVETRPLIDVTKLRRRKAEAEEIEERREPISVSAGAVEKALDLAFNPTREKLREVTIIDRMQGRLFPVLDTINVMWADVLEIAQYRQDKEVYKKMYQRAKPVPLNWLDELLYRTAQWQKSVSGTNLTKITDIALAETETRGGDEGESIGGVDAWGKE